MLFKKYCLKTNIWEDFTQYFHCCVTEFSICAYLENLFLLGGYSPTEDTVISQCIEFNTETNCPEILTSLNVQSCTADVISGRSGGYDLRSVKAYY